MRPVHPSPSPDRIMLGSKLRSTRRAQGLTIEQVAEATGLTRGFISRIERDETSPSVASLLTLCQVLSLSVGSLFATPEMDVVHLDEAPFINMGGTGAVERLLTPRAQSKVQVLRSTIEPGADGGKQLYTVNCDIEVIHVLSGTLEVRFAGETVLLIGGDTLTFAGREPHSWTNPGTTESEVLWTLIPAAWSGSS